jgi:hypothetical protein
LASSLSHFRQTTTIVLAAIPYSPSLAMRCSANWMRVTFDILPQWAAG